jgi:hypothetical protein
MAAPGHHSAACRAPGRRGTVPVLHLAQHLDDVMVVRRNATIDQA